MNFLFRIHITDPGQARKQAEYVRIGRYFLYEAAPVSRLKRLATGELQRRVVPITHQPVTIAGVTLTPERCHDPLACVVAERDVYRAGEDAVRLGVALAAPPGRQALEIRLLCNGEAFGSYPPALAGQMGVVTLAPQVPGCYQAQLWQGDKAIGRAAEFTVAEYTLAPLSAQLLSHELHRTQNVLRFALAVESYQEPFAGTLSVVLLDNGMECDGVELQPQSAGRYAGTLGLPDGNGPFRLRLMAANDPERVAEVVIPGSRKAEREYTVLSELGTQMRFALLPEPEALPVRGGWLSRGETLATPLIVSEVMGDKREIHVQHDMQDLQLVCLDLVYGRYQVQAVGDCTAGSVITVTNDAPLLNVFAGAFVNGEPFEGYTSFIRPAQIDLGMEVPDTLRPQQTLTIKLHSSAKQVLLSVRDRRLTATDTPAVALGAAFKSAVAEAVSGFADDEAFSELSAYTHYYSPMVRRYRGGGDDITFAGEPLAFADGPVPVMAATAVRSLGVAESADELDFMMEDGMISEALAEEEAAPVMESDNGLLPPTVRTEFPEVLFYGVVEVDGSSEIFIPVGDSLGVFSVEAFAVSDGDWAENRAQFILTQPVRADWELPPAVTPGDSVSGRLRVAAHGGRARVSLTCDGAPVTLHHQGQPLNADDAIATPAELSFPVQPGDYCATVTDFFTGESDRVEGRVDQPGKLESLARELRLLQAGDRFHSADIDGLLETVLLPALDEPFQNLLQATADYSHHCCEQTAAKILAGAFMYLNASEPAGRGAAERIILTGIAREERMYQAGKGFRMYPENRAVYEHYSRLAVTYLWQLHSLHETPGLSPALQDALQRAAQIADNAGRVHHMQRIPLHPDSLYDAYTLALHHGDKAVIRQVLNRHLDFGHQPPQLHQPAGQVQDRSRLAYAAAALLVLGEIRPGIALANQVTRHFNANGRLYATTDSAAAVALMAQLQRSGVTADAPWLKINGKKFTGVTSRSGSRADTPIETLEVLAGVAMLQIHHRRTENWDDFRTGFPLQVTLHRRDGDIAGRVEAGERLELRIHLPDGYQPGDLAHVMLPACLSWIHGGAKIKRLSLDFGGEDELRIPLAVTSNPGAGQHFAVCVRNMFEEERGSSAGLLRVSG